MCCIIAIMCINCPVPSFAIGEHIDFVGIIRRMANRDMGSLLRTLGTSMAIGAINGALNEGMWTIAKWLFGNEYDDNDAKKKREG